VRIPSILSPVTSLRGAVEVIAAGADELYCAVQIPKAVHLLNRPARCCVPTYEELGAIARYAQTEGVGTVVTLELPFISEFMAAQMRDHISSCVSEGIDALIVGDVGLIRLIKDMGLDVPVYASTLLGAMNCKAVEFIHRLGVKRVIPDRHLTIEEIGEMVRRNQEVEIEVFVHGVGCSNINANCYLELSRVPRDAYGKVTSPTNLAIHPCRLPFDVYEFGDRKRKLARAPILDAFTFCSLCQLPELIDTGISGIKIVGRCMPLSYQVKATKMYRDLLGLMRRGARRGFNRAGRKRFRGMIATFEEEPFQPGSPNPDGLWPTHRDVVCASGRCYYNPLFHTPYRSVDLSPSSREPNPSEVRLPRGA
jgi:putative protease